MGNNYVTVLLIAALLLALISFTSRMAEATPKIKNKVEAKHKNRFRAKKRRNKTPRAKKPYKDKLKKLRAIRDRARRQRTRAKRTLRENFQVKPKIKSKNFKTQPKVKANLNRKTLKVHKNPKKPLTKRAKCNKVCQYQKLRLMMLFEAANDYQDSHYIENGFNNRTTIKKRKKK